MSAKFIIMFVSLLGGLAALIFAISKTSPRVIKLVAGFLGMLFLGTFVIGLSHSISTGFAGFKGGLPFAIIAGFVLCLAAYDFFDECVRNKSAELPGEKTKY